MKEHFSQGGVRLNCSGDTMPTKDSPGFLCETFHIGNYKKSFGLLVNIILQLVVDFFTEAKDKELEEKQIKIALKHCSTQIGCLNKTTEMKTNKNKQTNKQTKKFTQRIWISQVISDEVLCMKLSNVIHLFGFGK